MEQPEKRRILIWQVAGFVSMVAVGSLLHFTYVWSNYSPVAGLFSAVNESVWEHLKLGFTALLLFSAVEYAFVGKHNNRYAFAKALGLLTHQVFIVAFFYIYTAFTGFEILILDVSSFVVGSALCQLIVYKVLTSGREERRLNTIGVVVLLAHAVVLLVFTFWTPERGIFMDPHSGEYGTKWIVDPERRGHDH